MSLKKIQEEFRQTPRQELSSAVNISINWTLNLLFIFYFLTLLLFLK